MLTSLAYIFLAGLLAAYIFKRLKLPSLLGMLLIGILLGPHLDDSLISISAELRQLALVIILARVGLALDLNDLKKVGRPALLMCWLPASFEIIGVILLAPILLNVTLLEAAIIGTVVAAVSPAVIVPRMLQLMADGYGNKKSIPQLLMAGASVDDIFVIVLFASFTGMATGEQVSTRNFIDIPLSILFGAAGGIIAGMGLEWWFRRFHFRATVKVLIFLSMAFLFIALEQHRLMPFSGLVAVISIGLTILKKSPKLAEQLSVKFNRLWVGAEVLLFVLIGATVDINYALTAGPLIILLITGALFFRMAGVWCCLFKTFLSLKEKLFCMLAYLPKATVQAAIGSVPLSMGLACGQTVLAIAVISILITAPLGALAIDLSYKKLLQDDI